MVEKLIMYYLYFLMPLCCSLFCTKFCGFIQGFYQYRTSSTYFTNMAECSNRLTQETSPSFSAICMNLLMADITLFYILNLSPFSWKVKYIFGGWFVSLCQQSRVFVVFILYFLCLSWLFFVYLNTFFSSRLLFFLKLVLLVISIYFLSLCL